MSILKKIVKEVGVFFNAVMEARAQAIIARTRNGYYHWD
jgi:hypothetical protein